MIREIEQDTAEEIIRSGRALIAMCAGVSTDNAPAGFSRAAIDLKVLLNELDEQVTDPETGK